jgi:hypothetical protein
LWSLFVWRKTRVKKSLVLGINRHQQIRLSVWETKREPKKGEPFDQSRTRQGLDQRNQQQFVN